MDTRNRSLDMANLKVPVDLGLNVRNPNTNFTRFFELKLPYMMMLEYFDFQNDNAHFLLIGPNHYSAREQVSDLTDYLESRVLHKHDFFEIMFVLKGSTIQKIEEQEYVYHVGQCCLLNHAVRHVEIPTEDTELYFLMLSDDFLTTLTQNDILFDKNGQPLPNRNPLYQLFRDCIKNPDSRQKQYWDFYPVPPASLIVPELEKLFAELIVENKKLAQGSYLSIQSIIAKLLGKMLDPALYRIREINPKGNKDEALFSQIQIILEEHHGKISRKELASIMNYDTHHLNRIVNRQTGMSLLEYGRFLTIKEAARLLISTNESITAIMSRLDMSNRSYFYRTFKEQYGVTPNEYRKKYQND